MQGVPYLSNCKNLPYALGGNLLLTGRNFSSQF